MDSSLIRKQDKIQKKHASLLELCLLPPAPTSVSAPHSSQPFYLYTQRYNQTIMNHHHADAGSTKDTCSMNTSFTWSYKDTCIIFSCWKIKTSLDLLLSCVVLISLSLTYEWLKYNLQLYNSRQVSLPLHLNGHTRLNCVVGSCLYGCRVGFSFLLMLVFMTYNGWLMLSVLIGAMVGHYLFGYRFQQQQQQQDQFLVTVNDSLACH